MPTIDVPTADQGLEGDIGARFTGDGILLSNDVIILRQFAVGLVEPNPTFNEFQRADTAPHNSKGDGLITIGDVIQARRFAAGIDLPKAAGGPTAPAASLAASTPSARRTYRGIEAGSAEAVAGAQVTIPVNVRATGEELGVSFTLDYDKSQLYRPLVEISEAAPSDLVLTVNDRESGRIRILIDSDAPFPRGYAELIRITFEVAPTAMPSNTRLHLSSGSIADDRANELEAAFSSGMVTIKPRRSKRMTMVR